MASNNTQAKGEAMKIKKVRNADFHNANGLNGSRSHATYGVFKDGVQVGFVVASPLWDAVSMDGKTRLHDYSCRSLKQLKECLANR